jgi:hypothetical protein
LAEAVVEDVQVLDQQITPGRQVGIPEQGLQIVQRRWLHAPSLGGLALALARGLNDLRGLCR